MFRVCRRTSPIRTRTPSLSARLHLRPPPSCWTTTWDRSPSVCICGPPTAPATCASTRRRLVSPDQLWQYWVIVTCDWDGLFSDGPQTIGVQVDVSPDSLPNQSWSIDAVVDNAQSSPQVLATQQLFVTAPLGSVSLSGHVVTIDNVPVNEACVFILANPPRVRDSHRRRWQLGRHRSPRRLQLRRRGHSALRRTGRAVPVERSASRSRAGRAATRVLRQYLD